MNIQDFVSLRVRWVWCARYGIALGLIAGLLVLFVGSILSAIYGVDHSAIPGIGITGR